MNVRAATSAGSAIKYTSFSSLTATKLRVSDAVCLSCRMQRRLQHRSKVHSQKGPSEQSLGVSRAHRNFFGRPLSEHSWQPLKRKCHWLRAAYVSAPVAEPHDGPSEEARLQAADPSAGFATPKALEEPLITWKLVAGLVGQHKLRVICAVLAVMGGTVCTLSMPQFSGEARLQKWK